MTDDSRPRYRRPGLTSPTERAGAPFFASPAAASAGTVQLSVTSLGFPYDPFGDNLPTSATFNISVSGIYTESPSQIDVFVHGGPGGCPATDAAENSNLAEELITVQLGNDVITSGSYTEQAYWGIGVPAGMYWVCAYLLAPQTPGQGPSDPPQATASASITQPGPSPAPIPSPSSGTSACVVPKVVGRKLAAARTALRAAHCRAGKIARRKSRRANRGRVISQSPRARTRRPAGASVNLIVGR